MTVRAAIRSLAAAAVDRRPRRASIAVARAPSRTRHAELGEPLGGLRRELLAERGQRRARRRRAGSPATAPGRSAGSRRFIACRWRRPPAAPATSTPVGSAADHDERQPFVSARPGRSPARPARTRRRSGCEGRPRRRASSGRRRVPPIRRCRSRRSRRRTRRSGCRSRAARRGRAATSPCLDVDVRDLGHQHGRVRAGRRSCARIGEAHSPRRAPPAATW